MSGTAVYLDFAATTPIDPRVADAMQSCLSPGGTFANPASIHIAGRESAALVEKARQRLADLLGADPRCLIWTSGATESDNLAIMGAASFRAHRGKHLITMPTEHKAVTDTFAHLQKSGYDVTWLKPDADGLLSIDELESSIRADTQLVSIMHINNETGVIQDMRRIGELCHARDILFHTDAAQSVGKLPLDLGELSIDLLSLTAHKFYGPQGIGALYIADRPGCQVLPILHGGGQERRLRPGSLPVHQIVGAGTAAEITRQDMANDLAHVTTLRDRLWQGIKTLPGILRNGSADHSYPGILNISVPGVEGESLMLGLEPVCAASGSACNSTSGESSFVLRALGRDDALAQSAIRFSFGRTTTNDEIDVAVERYRWSVDHLLAIAPLAGPGG
ncbi:cysteine desulfurase (tRNA sulfurtransferase), PLP-dependent [uncultured Woeseiaceae bacterium]|uniref:cysteine desulfurase n=1 Tax=uncultured Woeseiaceae bacterium TaxID=1983305 RepID=A0A7D9H4Q6_9GAMM|nr:cysteine desulfurase (tRNA sulfurtransferase), PLP-dependent [uncultured Woeseiaceae bacterium]